MYKLICNGSDIIYNSNTLSWNSDTDTLGTQLSFDTIKDLKEGMVVSLFNDKKELIRGIIIKKTIRINYHSYIVQDYSFYLKNEIRIEFNGTTATNAINSMLAKAYIKGDICSIPTKITDRCCEEIGSIIDKILETSEKDQGTKYFKEIDVNVLKIRRLYDMKINPKIYIAKDFDVESSIENMKNKIEVIGNEENNKSLLAKVEASGMQYFYGVLSKIEQVSAENIAQAKNIANNLLNELNVIERSTTIPIVAFEGADDIKANRMIYINAGLLCGYYKIKSANLSLVKGLHKIDLGIDWKVKV